MLAVVLIVLIFTDRAVFFAGGLLSAVYVYQFLHLHRQYGGISRRYGLSCKVLWRAGELAVGIGASQIISNVPATLLLADFTHNLKKSYDRRESGRTGNAHRFDGEPDLL